MTREMAEMLAIRALGYLAGDPEQLARFLALTGVTPDDVRSAASEPAFQSGVLDFFLGDEAVLLAFAASTQTDPADIAIAREVLSRHADD